MQLSEYTLNDTIRPFESWHTGGDLFRDVDRQSGGILDRDVRLFVEECDAMQGFQIFTGTDDAWGGWMAEYVDHLRDEFGKKSIWVYGMEDERQAVREKMLARKANSARSLAAGKALVDGYMRLSSRPRKIPEYINLDDSSSDWTSTALIAAAMESASLSIRLRDGTARGSSMADFAQTLNTNEGQNIWELGLSVDWKTAEKQINGQPPVASEKVEDEGDEDDSTNFDINFTPNNSALLPNTLAVSSRSREHNHVFAQVATVRRPKPLSSSALLSKPLGQEELFRRRYNEQAIVERFAVSLAFPRLDAYPVDLFSSPDSGTTPSELSLTCGFTTPSTTKQNVFDLRDLVTRHSRAIPIDEREELYNGLTEVGEKYAFGWESDVESEDD